MSARTLQGAAPACRAAAKRTRHRRAGSVLAVVIVLLLILEIAVASLLMSGASEQSVAVDRLETVRANYAAESGMALALRELMLNADEDGDGGIGSISDDDNDSNDPALGAARLRVTVSREGGLITITSAGRCGRAERIVQMIVQ